MMTIDNIKNILCNLQEEYESYEPKINEILRDKNSSIEENTHLIINFVKISANINLLKIILEE